MVLFLIGATCKVRHLLERRRLLEGGAYFDEDNQIYGACFEVRRLLEEVQYSSVKSGLKRSMYRHLCSPSILCHKTNCLKFAPLQLIIQKLHKFTPYTEIFMLCQQTVLSTQLQIAPLVTKRC